MAHCNRCYDTGWYFTWTECRPRTNNHSNRSESGMVVCTCPVGQAKNLAIRQHGTPPKKKKRFDDEVPF